MEHKSGNISETHKDRGQVTNFNRHYLRNGWSYGLQIWREHSNGPSEQKPIKNLGEKGAWAHPGTTQFLETLIILGTCEAADFKFGR